MEQPRSSDCSGRGKEPGGSGSQPGAARGRGRQRGEPASRDRASVALKGPVGRVSDPLHLGSGRGAAGPPCSPMESVWAGFNDGSVANEISAPMHHVCRGLREQRVHFNKPPAKLQWRMAGEGLGEACCT